MGVSRDYSIGVIRGRDGTVGRAMFRDVLTSSSDVAVLLFTSI